MQSHNSFESIIRQVIREELESAFKKLPITAQPLAEPDKIFIEELEKITGYAKQTIYVKVSKDEIPVLSSGRPLIFSRKQIFNWIECGRPKNWREYV